MALTNQSQSDAKFVTEEEEKGREGIASVYIWIELDSWMAIECCLAMRIPNEMTYFGGMEAEASILK